MDIMVFVHTAEDYQSETYFPKKHSSEHSFSKTK